MSVDPLLTGALDLLSRGHTLYAGPDPDAAVTVGVTAPGEPPAAVPARRTTELNAALQQAGRTDTELADLLGRARRARGAGRRATGRVLAAAYADTLPGVDTAIGRREALRRMAARLHRQHRHIHRSRHSARDLARRTRWLRYRHDLHRVRRAQALPLRGVRYTGRFPPGAVRARILAALDHLGITDPRARRRWLRGYRTLIARESSGDPSAIAAQPATAAGRTRADGHPLGYARGLTQTLPQTFARYHQPGTSPDIYDPVANICASMNYVMHRYGVTRDGVNLTAVVQQADAARPAKGY